MLAAHQIQDPVVQPLQRRSLADIEQGVGVEFSHSVTVRDARPPQDQPVPEITRQVFLRLEIAQLAASPSRRITSSPSTTTSTVTATPTMAVRASRRAGSKRAAIRSRATLFGAATTKVSS